jgi:hypothetical protein
VSNETRRFPYAPVLAFLRTRLLGAVLMPALIGAAAAARWGEFRALRFLLVLVGLAAAELLNLFGSDYAVWRSPGQRGPAELSALPGNPVVSPARLKPQRIPLLLLPVALVGLAVLLYFAFAVGAQVLLFFIAAAAIGWLYVWSPFPYAFLSTALIPPLISGGTYLALSGELAGRAFWSGLPAAWISVAVILGYRLPFSGAGRRDAPGDDGPGGGSPRGSGKAGAGQRRRGLVLAVYALAGAALALLVPSGVLPAAALLALLPWAGCLVWVLVLLWKPAGGDAPGAALVPATAVGVLMHTLCSGALALALWLG